VEQRITVWPLIEKTELKGISARLYDIDHIEVILHVCNLSIIGASVNLNPEERVNVGFW
jgi:hypothetical protein